MDRAADRLELQPVGPHQRAFDVGVRAAAAVGAAKWVDAAVPAPRPVLERVVVAGDLVVPVAIAVRAVARRSAVGVAAAGEVDPAGVEGRAPEDLAVESTDLRPEHPRPLGS